MTDALDISIVKNNDLTIEFTVSDIYGNRVNLTDFIIVWQVKKAAHTVILIEKQTADGTIVISDPTNGIFQVSIAADDTEVLPAGTYLYEAVVTDTNSKSVTLTDLGKNVGKIRLREQITDQDS